MCFCLQTYYTPKCLIRHFLLKSCKVVLMLNNTDYRVIQLKNGCSPDGQPARDFYNSKVDKISIKTNDRTLKAGKRMSLKASVSANGKDANEKVIWSSSDPRYASVNSRGVVTAKKQGKENLFQLQQKRRMAAKRKQQ